MTGRLLQVVWRFSRNRVSGKPGAVHYLGTEAITRVTSHKRSSNLIAWPSKLTPQAVRVEVDKACQNGKEATLRDVLWVTTVELVVKGGGPSQPEGK